MHLRFDDYILDWVPITNGIGQGDPLSMILYIIYNLDLVDVAKGKDELALAFIDDTAFLAIGKTFNEMHGILPLTNSFADPTFTPQIHNTYGHTAKISPTA